jgi:DNA repair exonuclease SbcCD ATPase subunit
MKKEQLQVVKDAIKNLGDLNDKIKDFVNDALEDIDREFENLGALQEKLEEEHTVLSEEDQEGDKGTELKDLAEEIEGIKEDIENVKDEFDDNVFGDIISKLEELLPKK